MWLTNGELCDNFAVLLHITGQNAAPIAARR